MAEALALALRARDQPNASGPQSSSRASDRQAPWRKRGGSRKEKPGGESLTSASWRGGQSLSAVSGRRGAFMRRGAAGDRPCSQRSVSGFRSSCRGCGTQTLRRRQAASKRERLTGWWSTSASWRVGGLVCRSAIRKSPLFYRAHKKQQGSFRMSRTALISPQTEPQTTNQTRHTFRFYTNQMTRNEIPHSLVASRLSTTYERNSSRARASSSFCTGFPRKSSMPASRQR